MMERRAEIREESLRLAAWNVRACVDKQGESKGIFGCRADRCFVFIRGEDERCDEDGRVRGPGDQHGSHNYQMQTDDERGLYAKEFVTDAERGGV